jgi:8-oxo-dGTP diphosphatase
MHFSHSRTQRRSKVLTDNKFLFSAFLNVVLVVVICTRGNTLFNGSSASQYVREEFEFHGGHPVHGMKGNCICESAYCGCSPSLAIDLVIVTRDEEHLLLVRRKDTDQLATMGGFVKVGETVEEAIDRELMEETGLALTSTPILLGIYSDPRRDNRRHTASVAFYVTLDMDHPTAVAADDVKEIVRWPLAKIDSTTFFSDHKTIITDYLNIVQGTKETKIFKDVKDNFSNVKRSICPVVGDKA